MSAVQQHGGPAMNAGDRVRVLEADCILTLGDTPLLGIVSEHQEQWGRIYFTVDEDSPICAGMGLYGETWEAVEP